MDHLNVDIKDQVNIKRPKQQVDPDLERVRRIIQEQRANQKRRKRKKRPFPVRLASGCVVSLVILSGFHYYQKEVLDYLKNMNVKVKVSPVTKVNAEEKKEAAKPAKKQVEVQNKEEWTDEEIRIFQGLEERRKELDQREKNLNALADEIQSQRQDLDKKLAEIKKIREDISSALSTEVNKDEKRVQKLVEVYSNMKPALAAKLFEELDEKLAIEILGKMKKANAANILNYIEPAKARRLSEKYAGYINK
tara:strand:+ start:3719 stop:4468 length:750 start_codon:yes stop_codon:yes gene_type:complete